MHYVPIVRAPGPSTIYTTTAIQIIKQLTHGSVREAIPEEGILLDKSPFGSGKGCFRLLSENILTTPSNLVHTIRTLYLVTVPHIPN